MSALPKLHAVTDDWEVVPSRGRPDFGKAFIRFSLKPSGQHIEYFAASVLHEVNAAIPGKVYVRHLLNRARGRMRVVFSDTPNDSTLAVSITGQISNAHMVRDLFRLEEGEDCRIYLTPVDESNLIWEGDIPSPYKERLS